MGRISREDANWDWSRLSKDVWKIATGRKYAHGESSAVISLVNRVWVLVEVGSAHEAVVGFIKARARGASGANKRCWIYCGSIRR